jgi:hypothetical protein
VKGAFESPSLINFALTSLPEITHTSLLFEVQTVSPVEEFDAHEFIISGSPFGPVVLIVSCFGVLLKGSTVTTAMFGEGCIQEPFGIYATTFLPLIKTDCELAPTQEPGGTRDFSANPVAVDTMHTNNIDSKADIRQNVQYAINLLKAKLRTGVRTIVPDFVVDPGPKGILPQFISIFGNIVSPPCKKHPLLAILAFIGHLSTKSSAKSNQSRQVT